MLKIAADSCSNITIAEAKELGIELIPLTINFDDESYLDEVEMSKKEFYERLVASKTMPKTSQPCPSFFEDLFTRAKESGDEVLFISLSSKLSGTYQTAVQAKERGVRRGLRLRFRAGGGVRCFPRARSLKI